MSSKKCIWGPERGGRGGAFDPKPFRSSNVVRSKTTWRSDFVLARGGVLALASEQMTRRAVLLFAPAVWCVFSAACAKKKRVSARAPARIRSAPNAPVAAIETGLASWYGNPYHGRAAANGE